MFKTHKSIGPITIYGANAMHWAVNITTSRWGYVCFRLPIRSFGSWRPLYFYVSPNATPWASTFYRGPSKEFRMDAPKRRERYGHNFDADLLRKTCSKCNGSKSTDCEKCEGDGSTLEPF